VTLREKARLRTAIAKLRADDDDYHEAMEILFNLLGEEYSIAKILRGVKTTTLAEIERTHREKT
jgi:hypothetical protein